MTIVIHQLMLGERLLFVHPIMLRVAYGLSLAEMGGQRGMKFLYAKKRMPSLPSLVGSNFVQL